MTSQFRMARFRTAQTGNDIFELTHDDPLPVQEGEVLVRFDWISVDPAMSGWTTDKRSYICLLYTSPSPRDGLLSRMPSSA